MDNAQKQTIEIPQETREFLEGLLRDANMTTLDDSMKEDTIQELFQRLDAYMTSAIVDNLEEQDIQTFIKMGEEGKSQTEIQSFLIEKVPNAQEVFTNAMLSFRNLYLGKVSEGRAMEQKTTE